VGTGWAYSDREEVEDANGHGRFLTDAVIQQMVLPVGCRAAVDGPAAGRLDAVGGLWQPPAVALF
jgi:hypothetical protein